MVLNKFKTEVQSLSFSAHEFISSSIHCIKMRKNHFNMNKQKQKENIYGITSPTHPKLGQQPNYIFTESKGFVSEQNIQRIVKGIKRQGGWNHGQIQIPTLLLSHGVLFSFLLWHCFWGFLFWFVLGRR